MWIMCISYRVNCEYLIKYGKYQSYKQKVLNLFNLSSKNIFKKLYYKEYNIFNKKVNIGLA
ncbi:hypothetical protein FDC58_15910 [Clostridium botulinum]|nr:hypothetical protein U728_2209 [Clostridium botulinum 202F]NFG41599.1 hypothetical protein [Clostridium botulinum]NFI02918.1 hypothetical protein [Clostridium botulinum]NFI63760.1 hypothetical protein [Clostridium botulinum]NFI94682.1 hypothetical protein [Clostridium botulinum]